MKKVVIGLVLALICFVFIVVNGRTFDLKFDYVNADSPEDFTISLEDDADAVEIAEKKAVDGSAVVTLRSVHRGKVFITAEDSEGRSNSKLVYVHALGTITENRFLGHCTGDWLVPVAIVIYLAILLYMNIRDYRRSMKESLYQYRNVLLLGLIIFLGGLLLLQAIGLFSKDGLDSAVRGLLSSAALLSPIALPAAFAVSLFVTASNFILMRREGRGWRNMLGCILGVAVCLGTIAPIILGEVLQRSTVIDVHNEQGLAMYVEFFAESLVLVIVSYLECLLLATVIITVKAARRVPAFDKDYMLILGCKIKDDGALTNLLKGRADRALEFERMQKDAVGKELVFIPSGGKGPDEVMPEAAAIANYLKETGVVDERIIVEDRSANTEENMRNSFALIKAAAGDANPRIAFSTTNYHVFRSGLIAREQGVDAEGIGSKTKRYFMINAFIREFIATLSSERRTHIRVMIIVVIAVFLAVAARYVSNVL